MGNTEPVIHWAGAGLSSVPGIRRLATQSRPLVVWNRTVAKARAALAGLDHDARTAAFDRDALAAALSPGDVLVSMLPGHWHVPLAQLCIESGAHFVSSSYIAPEMRALDDAARDAGVVLLNEVGLDPGIDHLMAHDLVRAWREDDAFDAGDEVSFRSYCGGFPAIPNEFRYKFSWSPQGVLKALASPARSIRDGEAVVTRRPWHAIVDHPVHFGNGRTETFEAYPNRDSLPFMTDYGFDPDWTVREFVRGTLRLTGWSQAWSGIFSTIESLDDAVRDQRIAEMSEDLWNRHAYDAGEADRVVLSVELQASRGDRVRWHQARVIDAVGNAQGSAMARLVSNTVALAVEAVADGELPAGVQAAPSDPQLVRRWFDAHRENGDGVVDITDPAGHG